MLVQVIYDGDFICVQQFVFKIDLNVLGVKNMMLLLYVVQEIVLVKNDVFNLCYQIILVFVKNGVDFKVLVGVSGGLVVDVVLWVDMFNFLCVLLNSGFDFNW